MNELAKALVAAQADMPAVEKDGTNPHFRSRFTTLDHLIAKTKPVLHKHGLVIAQFPSNIGGQPSLRTVLLHASGESIEADLPLAFAKQDMQGLGGALTYARRYGWASVLGIASEDDDDGNAASTAATDDHLAAQAQTASTDRPQTSASHTEAPVASDGVFRWPSGKHSGSTLAETPRGYVEWAAKEWKDGGVRAACEAFLAEPDTDAPFAEGYQDDIPFAPTIDGAL